MESRGAENFRITKMDDERRLVFGWANVAVRASGQQIIDHGDDLIDVEDLEEAAYQFVLDFRLSGAMHEGEVVGHMIESFMVTPEKVAAVGLPPNALPFGWWVGFWIKDDEAWAKIKRGDYRMFSIQGICYPEEVEGTS